MRLAATVQLLLGVALAAFGAWLLSQQLSIFGAVLAGLGAGDAILFSIVASCGFRRLFWLRLTLLLGGLTELAAATACVLFLAPSTREKIVDAATGSDPTGEIHAWLEDHITDAAIMLCVFTGVRALVLFVTALRTCKTDRSTYDSDKDFNERLLSSANTFGYSSVPGSASKAAKMKKGGGVTGNTADRFSALQDEGAVGVTVDPHVERARGKYAEFYAKYSKKGGK